MPKSKVRKKDDRPVRAQTLSQATRVATRPSPTWYPIVVTVVLVVGLAYLVVNYIAGDKIPGMRDLPAAANLGIGFGVMVVGLAMAARWH